MEAIKSVGAFLFIAAISFLMVLADAVGLRFCVPEIPECTG